MQKADWDALGKRLGYANEMEMFIDLYSNQLISIPALGRRLNFTQATIARRIALLNIPKRSRGGNNRSGNDYPQKLRLWRFDQRILFAYPKGIMATIANVSEVTLQSYLAACSSKSWPKERTNGSS